MIDFTPAQACPEPCRRAAPRIAAMLAAHESHTLEFKRMGENKVVRKLLEMICAFANTEGGIMLSRGTYHIRKREKNKRKLESMGCYHLNKRMR